MDNRANILAYIYQTPMSSFQLALNFEGKEEYVLYWPS